MKTIRLAALISLVAIPAACGGGGGGGGSSSPPPPPPPPLPVITGPVSPLPPAFHNLPITPASFTGTVTGAFQWLVTAGSLPPGVTLTPTGSYSGTPTAPGSYSFTVTLADTNGTDTGVYTQVVLASVQETEPNEIAAEATLLPAGVPGTGALGVNDVDFWSFSATLNQVIEVQVFGTRRDFDNWMTGDTLPRVSLVGPDGTSFLTGISYFDGTTTGWYGGVFDLDIPRFRIPATGTYFVVLEPDIPGSPGGEYALRVNVLALGAIQVESEENDSFGTADAITPGTIRAMREDEDDDFYVFTVSAPTLVYFEIFAYRNGRFGIGGVADDDYFDPEIQLLGQDGSTVLAVNDTVWFLDSAIYYLIDTPGDYYLRVTESVFFGSDGDAEYYLAYGTNPVGSASEVEFNGDSANADPIAYGDVISGSTDTTDLDYFSFSGTAGDMVRIFFFDQNNNEVASDIINVTITVDDVNIISAVYNRAFQGDLSNSSFGLNCERAILPATGTYYVVVWSETVATDYTFQLVRFMAPAFETEANNTPGTADAIPGPGVVAGVIDSNVDVDVFSFSAIEGEIVNFSIHAGAGAWAAATFIGYTSVHDYGSQLLPDLEIVNSSGAVQDETPYVGGAFTGESMTNGLATSGITFRAPSAGTFYVRIMASDATGSADHLYVLEKR